MAAIPSFCEQKGGARAESPPRAGARANTPAARPDAGERPAGGARLPHPLGNPVQRMMAMTPEQRERILEKLPPQQQANIRQRLERFDKLPPAEKARQLQMLQRFSDLPPEKQQLLSRQLQAFSALPEDRRAALGKELMQLSRMQDSERQARLDSKELKGRFSPPELQMLSDITENYPFTGK